MTVSDYCSAMKIFINKFLDPEVNRTSETYLIEDRQCAKIHDNLSDYLAECLHTGDYLRFLLQVLL
jgi:hypothetical protein